MSIEHELLSKAISEIIKKNIENLDIDMNEIVQTTALSALAEIQAIIKKKNQTDFETVDNIVSVFEKYSIETDGRNDF